ncbi:dihydroorotate dehydrogenase electron transfer subunit [Sulfuriflexus mobilis]|uniref:dihydroorotate dehydrogenase electron transfer subunit n=1 Tax=Sulfuriflexus mobilis TaxID=1811807 RepID=UPI000F82BB95|nr:dihydroorotate dehydrogenase electron transfer subunit [Sulfuriflexus mobilis]
MSNLEPHRNTIFTEDAVILSHDAFAGDQYILRLQAPKIAASAEAGSFVHIRCAELLPMRRPISIMRVDASNGYVDLLYKALGHGTRLLAERKVGETVSVMGPIGRPFAPSAERKRPLLIGGGVGMPPMVFIADSLRNTDHEPFVILGSEVPFPFKVQPSQHMIPGLPAEVIGSMPLMEDWGVICRLASLQGYPGCYEGYVTDLARIWLDALSEEERNQVEIFSCGPHPMLEAVAKLAAEYDLPCQVSLEEFMACAVGGCAGCVVKVETENGPAMKRVCVDGPVFDARSVF